MGNSIKKSKHIKSDEVRVKCEPDLPELCKRWSKNLGSLHIKGGSESEFMRRAAKTFLLTKAPHLKNIKGIDWDEIYT